MNKVAKEGLALVLLAAAYAGSFSNQDYIQENYVEKTYIEQHRDDGFGALELAITGLASVYILRKQLGIKMK
jgi:hypothetical protein